MNDLTILVTGAGAPGAPSIIKALRQNGERTIRIMGMDINPRASGSVLVDKFFVGPRFDSETFVQDVLDICESTGASIICPWVTRELGVFSRHLTEFSRKGITVCVMAEPMLSNANNKVKLLENMKACHIHTPSYFRAGDVESFVLAARQLGFPEHPICFKPAEANGSRGFRIFDPSLDRSDMLFNQKPNSVYANFDDIVNVLRSTDPLPELLVMEYLPGDEYSVDMLVRHGETLCTIPRKRLMTNGGISTVCVTEENSAVINYCEEIAACMNLHGNIGIQVKLDIHNVPQILEINPRLQGSVINCVAAGVNLPYLGIKLHLGEEPVLSTPVWGTQMVRRWEEAYFDQDGHAFAY